MPRLAPLVLLVLGYGGGALLSSERAAAAEFDAAHPTVLITGANRGIGLAFARYYAEADWNVIATARSPGSAHELHRLANEHRVAIEVLDVTDAQSIARLAESYAGQAIDVLINNAGVYGEPAAQTWGSLDAATFEQVMAVNVFGPLKVTEAFTPHLAASHEKKVIALTSGVSSLELGRGAADGILYAVSKAALNMAMRKAGMALREHDIIVALLAPGMIDTDMLALSRPGFSSGVRPEEVVVRLASLIDGLDAGYDGRPLNADGSVLPW